MNAASISATKPMAVASTPGRRTVPYHYDEGKERCSASGRCKVCRNSLPSTAQSTTTSTGNAISTADKTSSITTPSPLPSGGNSAAARAGTSANRGLDRVGLTAPLSLALIRLVATQVQRRRDGSATKVSRRAQRDLAGLPTASARPFAHHAARETTGPFPVRGPPIDKWYPDPHRFLSR